MKRFKQGLLQQRLERIITDEKKRELFQTAAIFATLGAASLFMSIVNIFTHQGGFTWVTLGFAIACVIDLVLLQRGGKVARASMILFSAEITALFFYFIITGIPDGFSVIWTVLLPSFGLLLFRIRYGSMLSLIMFLGLVFFFWVPFGRNLLQYEYSRTFMMRFPLLYLACFALAILLEKITETTHAALIKSQKEYEYLCYHDALTKQYNRFWLQTISSDPDKAGISPAAVAIIDIDNFKFINDSFGHLNGDIVIREIGDAIFDTLHGSGELCRWGGDEFLVLFHADIDAETVCRRIVDVVRTHKFNFDGQIYHSTLSIGLVAAQNGSTDDIDALVHQADVNLYAAKNNGKNRMISTRLGESRGE